MCQRVVVLVFVLVGGSVCAWGSCYGATKTGSVFSSGIDSGLGTRFADGNASARVLSYSSYYDEQNTLWTVGEIENTGDVVISNIWVEARYYNASNELVHEGRCCYAQVAVLPGRKAPFYGGVDVSWGSLKIHNCTMTVSSDDFVVLSVQDALQCLEILSNSTQLDWRGDLHVVGKVRNLAEDIANYAMAYATFYDGNGTVAGYGQAAINPMDLAPNETGTFDINKWGGSNWILTQKVGNIVSYSLTAEAFHNYPGKINTTYFEIIPEYTTIVAPLFAALPLTALIRRFSHKSGRRA